MFHKLYIWLEHVETPVNEKVLLETLSDKNIDFIKIVKQLLETNVTIY